MIEQRNGINKYSKESFSEASIRAYTFFASSPSGDLLSLLRLVSTLIGKHINSRGTILLGSLGGVVDFFLSKQRDYPFVGVSIVRYNVSGKIIQIRIITC